MIYLGLIMLSFFNSCGSNEPEYIRLSDKISDPFVAETKKKRDLDCVGYGGAFYTNVKAVNLTFETKKTITLPEVRRIFVEMSEDLIARYNANEAIRPFMDNYPFTLKNVRISLLFGERNTNPTQTIVEGVFSVNGFIYYTLVPPGNSDKTEQFEEPYNDAYRLIYGRDRDPPVELTPPEPWIPGEMIQLPTKKNGLK